MTRAKGIKKGPVKAKPAKPIVATKEPQTDFKRGYTIGHKDGIKKATTATRKEALIQGYNDGCDDMRRQFVTSVENAMAKVEGLDREEWSLLRTVPAWWISVIMRCYDNPKPKYTEEDFGG